MKEWFGGPSSARYLLALALFFFQSAHSPERAPASLPPFLAPLPPQR